MLLALKLHCQKVTVCGSSIGGPLEKVPFLRRCGGRAYMLYDQQPRRSHAVTSRQVSREELTNANCTKGNSKQLGLGQKTRCTLKALRSSRPYNRVEHHTENDAALTEANKAFQWCARLLSACLWVTMPWTPCALSKA